MLYMSEKHIQAIGINWKEAIEVVEQSVVALKEDDYAQPLKPYLRYRNPQNRIIAMPAFVGAQIQMAGIKWIASFPDNIDKGIPRASSVIVLNNADTGQVESLINTAMISTIRTSAVTGYVVNRFLNQNKNTNVTVGIIGFGPIGQRHLDMYEELFGDRISRYLIYDIRPIIDKEALQKKCTATVEVATSWEMAYEAADILTCCTVSPTPYVDRKPKENALILNISLRDFKPDTFHYFKDSIIVDDWDEVCRENTTIDLWKQHFGLQKSDVRTLVDVFTDQGLFNVTKDTNCIFCPMGMAVFDIAIATYYFNKATHLGIGVNHVD